MRKIQQIALACLTASLIGTLHSVTAQESPVATDATPAVPSATETTPVIIEPPKPVDLEPPVSTDPAPILPSEIAPPDVVVAPPTTTTTTTTTTPADPTAAPIPGVGEVATPAANASGPRAREFQGDDIGQVLRLLARQAHINIVVSDLVVGTVTMRLEDVTAMEAIEIILTAKGLVMDQVNKVYYVKTPAEKAAEPTESASYTFSFARASSVAPLLQGQLQAQGSTPQVDERTNTVFYREARSNLINIQAFLAKVDRPTKQVMIEARLVETLANPKQSYGINWAGTVGSSSAPQSVSYFGSDYSQTSTNGTGGSATSTGGGSFDLNANQFATLAQTIGGQFAILNVPSFSATLRLLNEDADTEFLAQPRIVTADNLEATIKIVTNRPVPSLNFNEQTATAVFGGFDDKIFGSTLVVKPSINKNNFITLSVRPEISSSTADVNFTIGGTTVSSPIIDTRSLTSNVLIKSGNTLAIGGLLQDEQTKAANKVPVLGDIPVLGYLFQEKLNARRKRNLLIFVTPTVIEQGTGTGLENQVGGLTDYGGNFADPNGWRNNAQGAYRVVSKSNASITSEYPLPGSNRPPGLKYQTKPKARE